MGADPAGAVGDVAGAERVDRYARSGSVSQRVDRGPRRRRGRSASGAVAVISAEHGVAVGDVERRARSAAMTSWWRRLERGDELAAELARRRR